jgi:hypothetical protein
MSDPSSSPARSSSSSLPQFPIELTDADATLQVHALVPPAGDTEQELCEDDLVVDESASDDILVEIAAAPLGRPPPPRAVPIPRPPPTLPNRRSMTSSISPMALDLRPPPPPRRRNDSTVLLPRVQEHRELRMLLLGASAAALALIGLGSLGLTVATSARAHAGGTATTSAPAAIVDAPAPLATARVAAPKAKELLSSISVLAPSAPSAPSTAPSTPANAPAWASAPVTASAPVNAPAPATSARTGVLRVPPSIHGILVDGKPRRVDGSTVVTCGRHAIKTGITPSRTVEIPCGGTAWL